MATASPTTITITSLIELVPGKLYTFQKDGDNSRQFDLTIAGWNKRSWVGLNIDKLRTPTNFTEHKDGSTGTRRSVEGTFEFVGGTQSFNHYATLKKAEKTNVSHGPSCFTLTIWESLQGDGHTYDWDIYLSLVDESGGVSGDS